MLGLGIGLHKNNFSGGGVSYDATYQAILDYATAQGYTLPSDSQKLLQNQLVIDLKASGVWAKLDTFANFATNGDRNFALIDWKRLTQYTDINSPTFTSNIGFNSNGTSSYISMNFNASTYNGNYKQNDASYGIYIDGLDNGVRLMSTSLSRASMLNSLSIYNGINSGNTLTNTAFFTPNSKLLIHDRSSSANFQRISNATINETIAQTSTGLPNYIWLLRDNFGYATSAQKYRFAFAGASISSLRSEFFNALNNYISGITVNTLGMFFGDSITAGANATPTANRWTSLFSAQQGITETNYGISGSELCSHPTTPDGNSMYERVNLIPTYVQAYKYLFFAYGTNDASSPETYTTTRFETQYNAILANAFSKGWPASKIKLVNIFISTNANEDAYNLKLQAIASLNNVQLLDVASVLSSNVALYMSDGAHPTNAGHSAVASYINSNIL